MNFWIDHFYRASLLAKVIYVILFGLSLTAWAIIFRKISLYKKVIRENGKFLRQYRKSRRNYLALYRHLSQKGRPSQSPMISLFMKGCEEIEFLAEDDQEGKRSSSGSEMRLSILQIESVEKILSMEMDRLLTSLEGGLTFLATTASVSPFLGLLGTVWGILQAFKNVGLQGAASMTSLAPGLAEALVTTVAGLMVAIPALIGYNFLGQKSRNLGLEGDIFIIEFITNLERFWGLK